MSSFANFKNKSKTGLSALKEKLESEKTSYGNENVWAPEVDSAGNFFGVIRFLPAPENEDNPFVQLFSHGFKIGEKWYIENCPTTLGKSNPCPVCTENSELWNTGIEENKTTVRSRKRQKSYYSNILVISDPKHPENNGKVFLYRYGEKIFEKIQDAISPELEYDTPFNPFDFWDGANFRLNIRKVAGYRNYDKSEFDTPKPLSEDDQFLETLWKQQYSLQEIIAKDKFKPFDELDKKFKDITRMVAKDASHAETVVQYAASSTPTANTTSSTDGEDDDLAAYAALLNS